MRFVLLPALIAATVGLAPARAQQCPMGAYPSVDAWGNQACKRFSDQSTATARVPPGQTCPMGSYPTADNFGNQVCRTFQAPNHPRTDYYDTSKGCPMGTYQSVDSYGNTVCKRF